MAAALDEIVAAFRSRPLEGPYTYVQLDALAVKVACGGRICSVAAVRPGVNADGHREILGLALITTRGRGRLAGLSPWPFGPRPHWRRVGDLRCPPGPCRCRSPPPCREPPGSAAGRTSCATYSVWCPRPPRGGRSQWCARSSHSPTPSRSHAQHAGYRRAARAALPGRRRAARRARLRHPRLHRRPQGGLAPGLVQQPPRAPQPRDPSPQRRGRDLPRPRRRAPSGRRRTGRTERRAGRHSRR